MMTMMTFDGDFTHLREIAYVRARDTASQHKMQLKGDDAPQHRGVINRGRKNVNKIRLIQEMEFNIIDLMRLSRLKSALRCGNSPQIGVLTPPCKKRRGANAKVPQTHPRKKFPTPPSYEVLT